MSEHSKVVNCGIPCDTCGGTEYVCAEATPPASDERREAHRLLDALIDEAADAARRPETEYSDDYRIASGALDMEIGRVAAILAAKEEK
jgi:hypothetical protein